MYENENYGAQNEYRAEPVRAKKKKSNGIARMLCTFVLCGILFGAVAAAAFYGVSSLFKGKPVETDKTGTEITAVPVETDAPAVSDKTENSGISTVTYSPSPGSESRTLDVSDIAESAMPAMVSITNISVQEVQSYFGLFGWGQSQTQQLKSSGSGIIIGTNDTELLIVTNNHVIEDATTLSVCFVDDEACAATVKGTDPDNDLAVIAVRLSDIKDSTASVIKQAKIGNSDSLKVGQQVVAIGNALGYGQSVTTGIVSAIGRRIDTTDAIMIQTDAAINPGNSGGALLNMNGELIGINSAKFSSTDVEGMGYAISITPATPIIDDLMNRTTREKVSDENASYLGVRGEDITSSISASYGIPQGVYVTSLTANGPAADAGITAKSIITHFDGIRVTSLSNLENRLQYYAAGETVEITVQVLEGHEYVEKTLNVTLGKASDYQSQGGYGYGYGGGYGYGRP
ncbi:MAG: trypsin-like peptidase domain-containing protein [Clostridia bacterium]|nr:trypsin-like peptidase domain-containing protein [Clostridia bacterium]